MWVGSVGWVCSIWMILSCAQEARATPSNLNHHDEIDCSHKRFRHFDLRDFSQDLSEVTKVQLYRVSCHEYHNFQGLENITKFKGTFLNISRRTLRITPALNLSGYAHLQELTLCRARFGPLSLGALPGLRRLSLKDVCGVDTLDLRHSEQLRFLDIQGPQEGPCFKNILGFGDLKVLRVFRCFSEEPEVFHPEHNVNLRDVTLSGLAFFDHIESLENLIRVTLRPHPYRSGSDDPDKIKIYQGPPAAMQKRLKDHNATFFGQDNIQHDLARK